jgi:5-methylcytosine-specific restriction enzyme subunit McrC
MAIPIQNLYYLLCYAWDKLAEKEIVEIKDDEAANYLDLFARVLLGGLNHLFKRGLDRYYIEEEDIVQGIKGKLYLAITVKQNLLQRHRTYCVYDDFSHNILHNQIIKTTITRLIRTKDLDEALKTQLRAYYWRLRDLDEITLYPSTFKWVHLHKNNYFYDFILKICELIYSNLLPAQEPGKYKFRDFDQNETQMSSLFESFIRNFYRSETSFDVGREDIQWALKSESADAAKYLPKMQTDVSLSSKTRKIIIETKYYKETFQQYYDVDKIHSANLYQLFAYIKNN